jgi:dTDP-glucose pyrophosphorylase
MCLTKAVKVGLITAAGQGKRMGYLSNLIPKCLFPIIDKPIIHHVIDNMKSVGIDQIYIAVNFQKEKLIEYIDTVKNDIGINIDFIHVKEILGLANSVMAANDYISEPFMVILGDDITITDSLSNLLKTFETKKADVVEGVVIEKNADALKTTCCVKLGEGNRIEEIIEKPINPPTNIRGTGVYLFSQNIFNYGKKISMMKSITDAIDLAAKDGTAYAEFINGININVNSYKDLLRAWIFCEAFKLEKSEKLKITNQIDIGIRKN